MQACGSSRATEQEAAARREDALALAEQPGLAVRRHLLFFGGFLGGGEGLVCGPVAILCRTFCRELRYRL